MIATTERYAAMLEDQLAGRGVVGTMPRATLATVRNHGAPRDRLSGSRSAAHAMLNRLAAAGIDLGAVADRLLEDGVARFAASVGELLAGLREVSRA
jgi:transaldolase